MVSMPIKTTIMVNTDHITTIQIARIKGKGMKPGDVNVYSVVESEDETWLIDWDEGVKFEHEYGTGVAVCVAKAIQALEAHKYANGVRYGRQ